MPYTLPVDTHAVGDSGHTTDHNNTVDVLKGMGATFNVQNTAYGGGADPSGSSPSDTALNALVTAIGTGNGYIFVPPGNYKVTSSSGWLWNLADTQQVLISCAPGVTFTYTGTGDCIRMLSAATSVFARGSGIIGNPMIDLTSAGANANGLHFGDILQGRIDASAQNGTGASAMGLHLDNTIAWTEQLTGRFYSLNNTAGVVFDESGGALTSTGSFARTALDVLIGSGAVTHNGVVLQNGANVYHGALSIRGNFTSGASGSPGAVLTLTGTAPAGHPNAGNASQLMGSRIDIGVEAPTGVVLPQSLHFGSTANTVLGCYGNMNFAGAGGFQASNLGTSHTFQFAGPIAGDNSLITSLYYGSWSLGALATGGTIPAGIGGAMVANPAGAITGVIIAPGISDGQQLTVVNISANLITFDVAATSHVAAGASATVPAQTNRLFIWRSATSRWYGGV